MAAMNNGQSAPTSLMEYCPNLHPIIEQVISKCLVPEPENRLQSMKELLTAISSLKHEDADHPKNKA